MTAPAVVVVALVVCYAIVCERSRRYGRELHLGSPSAIVPALAAAILGPTFARQHADPAGACVLLGCAAAGAAGDLQTGWIFDRMLAVASLAIAAFGIVAGRLPAGVAGAALAAGCLWAIYALGRGRWLGLGDVKLAGVIGLGLGPAAALSALEFAAVSGGVVAAALRVTGLAKPGSTIAFGPYLFAGVCWAWVHPA